MLSVSDIEKKVRAEYRELLPNKEQIGKHCVVLGIPASGKTTAIKNFVEKNSKWNYLYENHLIDNNRFRHYINEIFFNKNTSLYLNFQVEAVICRFFQNYKADQFSICDNDVISILAYTRMLLITGKIDQYSYETFFASYLSLNSFVIWPSKIILFKCLPEVARERVLSRGRPHEQKAYSVDVIRELAMQYEEILSILPKHVQTFEIDTTCCSKAAALTKLCDCINAS